MIKHMIHMMYVVVRYVTIFIIFHHLPIAGPGLAAPAGTRNLTDRTKDIMDNCYGLGSSDRIKSTPFLLEMLFSLLQLLLLLPFTLPLY